MKVEELFDRLVENAIDFLARSIGELKQSPKFSVIHFQAAVELFLKARLLAEHWSLVVSKRQEPDWRKFVAGDFLSVSLDEAAARLSAAVQSGLMDSELQAFRQVTKHRNKMVHFFHEAHAVAQGEQLVQAIAKEQLNAWYLLHKILTERWNDVFEKWLRRIGEINSDLREHREFLQVTFDNKADEIRVRKNAGSTFVICPSCGFDAHEYPVAEQEEIFSAACLACGFNETCIIVECSDCQNPVMFVNEGFAVCTACGREFEPESLAEVLRDDAAVHIAVQDGDDSWDLGNCGVCDGYHTVVRREDHSYFCTSCFGEFDSVERCRWCNEPNTGDMEHSYFSGCNHCDGKAGWDAGRDA